jgi:chromosome segregation protein
MDVSYLGNPIARVECRCIPILILDSVRTATLDERRTESIIAEEYTAALDEANSRKYGDMIENLSKLSQLILITHNRETMSRAGVLYGVTMGQDGLSKLLSIEFEEAVAVAK